MGRNKFMNIEGHDARIESTDRRIDEPVYKLYGLTNEEIRVVEKS